MFAFFHLMRLLPLSPTPTPNYISFQLLKLLARVVASWALSVLDSAANIAC